VTYAVPSSGVVEAMRAGHPLGGSKDERAGFNARDQPAASVAERLGRPGDTHSEPLVVHVLLCEGELLPQSGPVQRGTHHPAR
jgi:hypothetical protein